MAAPIIDRISPTSAVLSPGQSVDVEVVAHDPDSRQAFVVFPVADSQGNVSRGQIDLRIDDPITFRPAENPDNLSIAVQLILDPARPNQAIYRITAL